MDLTGSIPVWLHVTLGLRTRKREEIEEEVVILTRYMLNYTRLLTGKVKISKSELQEEQRLCDWS